MVKTKVNGMATDAPAKVETARSSKLAPMQKRLGKLRKQEAKRRKQLERLQAQSAKTTAEMTALIAAVNTWVQNPAVPAD